MAARRAAAALLLGAGSVGALPSWSWDTIQTYVHCANFSGEWNAGALQVLAKQVRRRCPQRASLSRCS